MPKQKKKEKETRPKRTRDPSKYQRHIFKGQTARTLLQRRGALVAGEKTMNALDLISRIFVTEVGKKSERIASGNKKKTIKADHALFTINKRMNMNLVAFEPKAKKAKKEEEKKKEWTSELAFS